MKTTVGKENGNIMLLVMICTPVAALKWEDKLYGKVKKHFRVLIKYAHIRIE